MPIPLYISPSTPLPGPADFMTPILSAFQSRDRRKDREQQRTLEGQRMQQQVSENEKDRAARASERKDTNEYNRGMLEMYKGDRAQAEQRRLQEAEDKAHQEWLIADMKGPAGEADKVIAEQKIAQLRRKREELQGRPQTPPPMMGPGFTPLY